MCTDKTNNKTIKYDPAKSVMKLEVGKPIRLTESSFLALFEAFFAEIEARFAEKMPPARRAS